MTERDCLLADILADPTDDHPRLVYADWLDENGESDRAEFIRVQLELARCKRCGGDGLAHGADRPFEWNDRADYGKCVVCWPLRRLERDLLSLSNCIEWYSLPGAAMSWTKSDGMHGWYTEYTASTVRCKPERGFISSLNCSWADWLRHSPALHWHPEQTVECNHCDGKGWLIVGFMRTPCKQCGGNNKDDQGRPANIDGAARIRRPLPPTAQPLEVVRLTTRPINSDAIDTVKWFTVAIGAKLSEFTRLKCKTCNGTTGGTYLVHCPDCHGTPPNRWTCDDWKGIVFVMPENSNRLTGPWGSSRGPCPRCGLTHRRPPSAASPSGRHEPGRTPGPACGGNHGS